MTYEKRDIFAEANAKWLGILPLFGVNPQYLTGRNCPCPSCGGKDRFRFTNFKDRGEWICNQCGHGNAMDLIMSLTGRSFKDAAAEVRAKLGMVTETKAKPRMSEEKARKLCVDLWKESLPIRPDCEADRYLFSRGFEPPFGQQLRFHPKVPVKDHPHKALLPAMLARVSDNKGAGVNIHRTYLEDGQKAKWQDDEGFEVSPKKMMPGAVPKDAAIRLFPHEGILAVAEGIETSLAVHRDYNIPCWSLINSSQMAKWEWPKGIKELHIFSDNDPKYGGQAAAFALAHRASVAKDGPQHVFVRVPDKVGEDWADR
jgi:putative DNA primase/helicase